MIIPVVHSPQFQNINDSRFERRSIQIRGERLEATFLIDMESGIATKIESMTAD